MIDLHCHILPGIDDGPATIQDSLRLARAACAAGIETIVATPHVSPEYPNKPEAIATLTLEVGEQLKATGLDLRLHAGAEVAMTEAERLTPEQLSPLRLAGGPWLLVECPFTTLASGFDTLVQRLLGDGHLVVLAHPERSPFFHRNPELLGALARSGVLSSITAGSLVGRFGRRVQHFTTRLAREQLIHNVASDAHDARRRAPGMRTEIEASELRGLTNWLTEEVPSAILAGTEIPPRPAGTGTTRNRLRWWPRRD